MRRLTATAAASMAVLGVFGVSGAVQVQAAGATAAASAPAWRLPVAPPATIISPFVAPVDDYSAGHRGVDLAVRAGDPVLAAADGVVSFAGRVVDRGVVSIAHGGGYVTSVEPVEPMVNAGAAVSRGQVIAVVGSGGHCDSGCLHVGVRLDGRYISPLAMLGAVPRAVLLPLE